MTEETKVGGVSTPSTASSPEPMTQDEREHYEYQLKMERVLRTSYSDIIKRLEAKIEKLEEALKSKE